MHIAAIPGATVFETLVWPKLLLESFLSETGVFEVGRFVGVLTNAWLVERVRETRRFIRVILGPWKAAPRFC
jgi:hypothetical protein